MQTFFVNGRFVKSQLLTAALEEAYANRIMKGKFPGCVLCVTLPPDTVDVNVHPAKTVVKFANDKQVFDLVYHSVGDALDREGLKPSAPQPSGFYQRMTAQQFRATQDAPAVPKAPESLPAMARVSDVVRRAPSVTAVSVAKPTEAPVPAPPEKETPQAAEAVPPPVPPLAEEPDDTQQDDLLRAETVPWRIAGEVLDTYIVCEDAERNVWLIDKHAAHERVVFDRLKAQDAPVMSQTLLTPLVVQLGAEEYAAVAEQFELLRTFGFECEDFGGGAVLVRAIPAELDGGAATAALEELAARFAEGRDPAAARDALLSTLACKAAIKGGQHSDERELRVLVERVQSGEIAYCPHGRPVKARLPAREFEKLFKRVV